MSSIYESYNSNLTPENKYEILLIKGYDVSTKKGYKMYKDKLNDEIGYFYENIRCTELLDDNIKKNIIQSINPEIQYRLDKLKELEEIVNWLSANGKLELQRKYLTEYKSIKLEHNLDIANHNDYMIYKNYLLKKIEDEEKETDTEKNKRNELCITSAKTQFKKLDKLKKWIAENNFDQTEKNICVLF